MTSSATKSHKELSRLSLSWVLNAPSILILTVILAFPILYSGYLSFHDVGLRELRRGDFPFVGFANYADLFSDPVFWRSLRNTLIFVIVSVTLEVVIGLGVAIAIQQRVGLAKVSRVLLLLPWAVPPIVNGLLWAFIFNTQFGYANRLLSWLGLIDSPINWLGDPTLAMGVVILAYVWRTVPFNILLYYAALQGIPPSLYEAARIDGVPVWRRFTDITLQFLRPILTASLILRTSFAFMVFDEVFSITQGGPGDSTWTAAWYTYKASFNQPFQFGLGAASAYVMSFIMVCVAIFYVKTVYKRID